MNQTVILALEKTLASVEEILNKLLERRELLIKCIEEFSKDDPSFDMPLTKKKVKQTAPTKVNHKPHTRKDGKLSMQGFILNHLREYPKEKFSTRQLTEIIDAQIKNGNINKGSRDTNSEVSTRLNQLMNAGHVIRHQGENRLSNTYQYNPNLNLVKSPKEKKNSKVIEPKSFTVLESAIIDTLNNAREPQLSQDSIASKIKYSEDYVEISKTLNGSLQECIGEAISHLELMNILIHAGNNEYSVNKKD